LFYRLWRSDGGGLPREDYKLGELRPASPLPPRRGYLPNRPCGAREMVGMEVRWLSVDEIGKYLDVRSDTVYSWIDKHAMPAHRLGRLWKFKKDQVDAWVEAGGVAETD